MKSMPKENIQLSHLAETLEGSQILQYSNAVKAMQGKGVHVHNYTVGDFEPSIFPIPIGLKNEVMKAYAEDYTNYPMAEGNVDLRAAIAAFEKEFSGISYNSNEVLVASGGRPLIYSAFQILCDKNDTVIYGTPSWNNHYFIQTVGAKGIAIPTSAKTAFLLTAEKIAPHIKEATLLCLCSPQNPTGTVYSKKALSGIIDLVVEENKRRRNGKKLYVLFDAMYGCLTAGDNYNYNPLQLNEDIRPYLITVNAVSKIFAATGMRVGWCLGPKEILQKMRNLSTHIGAWAPMAEQKAVARYLVQTDGVKTFLKKFKEELEDRLKTIYHGIIRLKQHGYPVNAIKPQGGIYLSVQFSLFGEVVSEKELQNAPDIANYLLEQSGFAILPFSVFGSPENLSWFRISVGTCRKVDIAVMLKKLEVALYPFQFNNVKEVNV
jgi:aspartate aminotransferase